MTKNKIIMGILVRLNNNLYSKYDWGYSGIKVLREETCYQGT